MKTKTDILIELCNMYNVNFKKIWYAVKIGLISIEELQTVNLKELEKVL